MLSREDVTLSDSDHGIFLVLGACLLTFWLAATFNTQQEATKKLTSIGCDSADNRFLSVKKNKAR